MRLVLAAIALPILAGTARADVPHLGDALNDLIDPRSVALGEAGRAMAVGDSSIALNPSGAALNKELVLDVDYGYRFSDSASIVNAAACDSTSTVAGCFYYHYTGASPDSPGTHTHSGLHVAGTTLAYPIAQYLTFGTGLKYYYFDTDDPSETAAKNFAADAGITARLGSIVTVGAAGYNLLGPSVEMPRAVGGGVYVKPVSSLVLAMDARWLLYNGDHGIRYGGGASFMLHADGGQMGFPITAGALHDQDLGVTYLSGGLGFQTMSFAVDVAARFSVQGPNDTEILASLRFWPVPRGATQ
jgi:hypothetical protein